MAEKSDPAAGSHGAPILPMMATTRAWMSSDYLRQDATSLLAAFESHQQLGDWPTLMLGRHQEFLRFLNLIDDAVPQVSTFI